MCRGCEKRTYRSRRRWPGREGLDLAPLAAQLIDHTSGPSTIELSNQNQNAIQ